MELQSEISKKYIADALILLMKNKDFSKITNKDITDKAGYSHITIYRNFKNKEEIVKYYCSILFKEWKEEWQEGTNIGLQIFGFFQKNKDFLDLLYRANLQYILIDEILACLDYKLEDTSVMAYSKATVAYLIFGWCNEWYRRGMKETPEEMAQYFNQIK